MGSVCNSLYTLYESSDKIKMEKYCTVSHLVKFVFFPFYFFSDFVKSLLIKINILKSCTIVDTS